MQLQSQRQNSCFGSCWIVNKQLAIVHQELNNFWDSTCLKRRFVACWLRTLYTLKCTRFWIDANIVSYTENHSKLKSTKTSQLSRINHTSGNEIFRQVAKSIHFAINAFAHFNDFFSRSKTATFQALVGYCFYAKYLLFWKRHRFQMNSKTKKTYLPICVCFCIHFLFKDSYSTFFYTTNVISICFKVHSS